MTEWKQVPPSARRPFPDPSVARYPDLSTSTVFAGRPRSVAGVSYFDPSTVGKPIVWKNGAVNYSTVVVNYYTFRGELSASVSQAQAGLNGCLRRRGVELHPPAALRINAAGSLAKDGNGTNF